MTTAPDGAQLASYRWEVPSTREPRPAYILHGLAEHAGRYDRLAHWLTERGWTVAAHDHRGHGRSSGPRGALPSEEALVDDAECLLEEYARGAGAPPLLIGHSLGALVATCVALRGKVELAGLVLSSPPFQVRLTSWQKLMIAVLTRLGPDLRIKLPIDPHSLTHDLAVADAYASDPLVHHRIGTRLGAFIVDGGERAIAGADALSCRTLLMVAGADAIAQPAGSRRFADNAPPGRLALRWYHQAFHELFNESAELAAPVYADLEEWLAGG